MHDRDGVCVGGGATEVGCLRDATGGVAGRHGE